ncbi:MAG: histidine kinase [Halomonas sp.]|nr:histidine kinase [Halomonas sp.]MDN6297022.1 histidine kinase [Halomonas sp.]MDN6313730.1 histidine kinase [Halomonas sp.]MDN6335709.1 histidine kinase [Halomonas sp.]
MKALRHSLVARIVVFLVLISSLAMASIGLTVVMAKSTQGDAAAINEAGALRLASARIINVLEHPDITPSPLLATLKTQLESSTLETQPHYGLLNRMASARANAALEQLRQTLNDNIIPAVLTAHGEDAQHIAGTVARLNGFIQQIDNFVSLREHATETRISLMGRIQALFLGLITLLLITALIDTRRNLARPLRRLMRLSRAFSQRRFDHRSDFSGPDELGRLGRTLDHMAAELDASYQALEARVTHKTAELERHNHALQIIHNSSRSLYGGGNDLCASAAPLLRRLEEVLDIGPIVLSLHNEHDGSDMEILATHSHERPLYCRDLECFACLGTDEAHSDEQHIPLVDERARVLVLPVVAGHLTLGYLTVGYLEAPDSSTRQLLNTLADQLATAIYLEHRIEEQQQLSLIQERTIIARELHDSLAQSLSYLKMQVARLERMQARDFPAERQADVIGDLREGLNSAYRQLRELLTTFRLSLDKSGLQPALEQTIREFSQRLGFDIEFSHQVPPYLLSANEEIHLLQITREALANTVKHAHAHWARVSLTFQQAKLHLAIEDDGIGFESEDSPPMHYGLVIMRDRARHMGARLTLDNRPEGGTGVHLYMTPQADRLIKEGSSHV